MNWTDKLLIQQQNELHVMQLVLKIIVGVAILVWLPLLIMALTEIYKDFFTWLTKPFRKKAKK